MTLRLCESDRPAQADGAVACPHITGRIVRMSYTVSAHITDPRDSRLADYVGLKDAHIRRLPATEQFLVAEGPEVVRRLVASHLPIRSILVSPNRLDAMAGALSRVSCPVYTAERSVMTEVIGFDLHRGVVATAARPAWSTLDDVLTHPPRDGRRHRLLMFESMNDNENLGAIARSARAFGIDALVLDARCADPYYRRTVRVSMGEILFMPIVRAEVGAVTGFIREAGGVTFALTPADDAVDIRTTSPHGGGPLVLLLGAEGPGLTPGALSAADVRVRIPIDADVDSLNVGHAAAVALALTSLI